MAVISVSLPSCRSCPRHSIGARMPSEPRSGSHRATAPGLPVAIQRHSARGHCWRCLACRMSSVSECADTKARSRPMPGSQPGHAQLPGAAGLIISRWSERSCLSSRSEDSARLAPGCRWQPSPVGREENKPNVTGRAHSRSNCPEGRPAQQTARRSRGPGALNRVSVDRKSARPRRISLRLQMQ